MMFIWLSSESAKKTVARQRQLNGGCFYNCRRGCGSTHRQLCFNPQFH